MTQHHQGFTPLHGHTLSSGPGHILNPPSFPPIRTRRSFHQNPEVGPSEFPETTSAETPPEVRI